MPSSIIIGDDYATRIRNRLGVTDADLAATDIDEMLPAVEYDIADRITTYASLAGKDAIYLKTGTVAALAAAMCPVLRAKLPRVEKGLSTSFESAENWDKKQEELLAEKEKYLSLITGYTNTYSASPLFALAGPSRT